MNNPVLAAIADRRSVRAYTNEKVTREQIDTLLKAAQEAPSARNSQPWHFSVVQNPGILAEINAAAQGGAGSGAVGGAKDIFHGAGLAFFLSCDPAARWARLDCGIAVQTIALAAHALGLGSVILGTPEPAFTGPREAYFNTLLRFPSGCRFAVAIAIGVPSGTQEPHPVLPDRVSFIA